MTFNIFFFFLLRKFDDNYSLITSYYLNILETSRLGNLHTTTATVEGKSREKKTQKAISVI